MKPFTLVLCGVLAASATLSQKKAQIIPLVRMSQLDRVHVDTVRLKGYVFSIYVCPPCPEGAQCKPCIENNLMVVEQKPTDPLKVPLEGRLRIFTQRPDSLKVGKRYLFVVRFRNRKSSPDDNVTLISFKQL